MVVLISNGGFLLIEWAMLAAYVLSLPWLTIGFWNAVIGLWLDRRYDGRAAYEVTPALRRVKG
ncbi:MAG: glucans biosynthesis glucosyltransferase MdoH, partial [Pseudomonadota bacterium]